RQHAHALPGAGLTDDADDLAGIERNIDAVHGPERAAMGLEVDRQIADFEQCHARRPAQRFSFGSSASRKPSPSRLKASTVMRMARPGKVTIQGALRKNSRASASIVPHSGVGAWAPRPRKPSAAASRMAEETPSVDWTIRGAKQFGSTVS